MKISMENLESVRDHATRKQPGECCGCIVETFENHPSGEEYFIYECNNAAENKEEEFLIEVTEYVSAEQHGEVVGIYHSHLQKYEEFSEADKTLSKKLELYSLLYILGKEKFLLLDPFKNEIKEIKYDPSKKRPKSKDSRAIVSP